MTSEIYLDANATSITLPAAVAAAAEVMQARFGNPSSTHAAGLKAKATLDAVRERARRLIGAGQGRLMFTSGATEGIQTAVLSALCAVRERQLAGQPHGSLLLYGATEHKAVPEALAHWNRILGTNLELRALPVDGNGLHRLDVLRELAPRAALVCTMAANNETGVVSDIAAIERILIDCASGALWMVDSVQALGKLKLDLAATRIDYAPFSGHKLYAPKGVGMLYVADGAPYTALMMGGGQEAGQRSGTENMAGIAALGAVLQVLEEGATFCSHDQLAAYREQLASALRETLPGVVFNMPFDGALPTTLNFSVPGLSSKELLDVFDAAGVRISSGSACSSSKALPSYVLEAMGLPDWRTRSALRMSFGPIVDAAFIDEACARIRRCGQALRAGCMLPSNEPPRERDGVVQFNVDGQCCYLVLDADSRGAVVIDPIDALAPRIAAIAQCLDYRMRAVQDTASDPAEGEVLTLGRRVLVRVADGYLLGLRSEAGLAPADVRFAFTGKAVVAGAASAALARLAPLINAQTILCPGVDEANMLCTTLAAEDRAPATLGSDVELDRAGLERFLRDHPDARLIDVRETCESVAADTAPLFGRAAESVPLSRLPDRLAEWLRGEQPPLVFFCRSGNRSARATRCLHRLGYRNAWHLGGGIALAG